MNDPFFDEDDGEFDDLYGDPPLTASSPAAQRKPRSSPSPAAQPSTPGGRPSSHRSAASSSVVSRSYARDRAGSATSNATEQNKRRRKRGKARRKDSQELFDVQWQSDVAVSRCGLCSADFSLVRRKHHCRHCGRVMCSDCSSFLFFEFSHRKHRVCATCNNQLLTEQDAYDREALGQQRDTTSNLVDDSSEDAGGRSNLRTSLVNAFTPKHNNEEERAKKKQEKKERKQREKLEKKGKAAPINTARISRRQVEEVEEKKSMNGAALFDGADDEWFSDVPGQRSRSRGSGDSEEGVGSKGPGWRDRVKDTYTVMPATEQLSVLVPMAGSTLTAGITGKGYISDQFRYDNVGGPGLGHDDDSSVEMPRPKQQPATMTYTGHSAKPTQLTGNGYFSEQFQYDDVGGPGLGHDDDRAVAMPRPKQQVVATPYSYDGVQPSGTRSEHDATDDNVRYEQEFEPRITFKENLKDIFSGTKRRESTAKKNEKKIRTTGSKPRARGNQNMTLDELNPSYSSEDEPRLLASAMPRPTLTPAQPTFYDDEADKLVVDESPGFFEATIAEREAQRQKEEEQQKQLAKDTAWVNGSALLPTVPPHRFSSEQDSYSIVDPPSHTSNSPVENQRRSRTAGDGVGNNGNSKGGFTGALKRFFGMGSKATEKATTPPRPATVPPKAVVAPPEKDGSEQNLATTNTSQLDITTREQATSRLERHTVMDYYADTQEVPAPQENVRFTMAGYVDSQDAPSRFEASVPSQVSGPSLTYDVAQQKLERKRRGTFDDLFESPKTSVPTDRYSSTGATGWKATAAADRASYGSSAVGVARFDQRRSIDEAELGAGPQSVQTPARSLNESTEAWRQPTALSLLGDRVDASQSEDSGFTWSNVRSVPGLGTATYAVPTSFQPRTIYGENHESPIQYDVSAAQSAPLGSIMDDLKRSSTLKKSPGKDPVDDFFAEFEEPNDYVFDPTTGGYVAARVPPRAVAARPVSRSESTELEAPQAVPEKVASRGSGHDYYAPSESNVRPTARTGIPKDQGVEEVDDEVAEIIVDKISSLESELAALKQLIRSRKGGGGSSQVAKPHNSAIRSSDRKASIFDKDSSDEEENGKPGDPYATSLQPPSRQEGKHRPVSKKKHVKKRKDSFADLFEDSPNEAETLGGATSYEALFQTGTTRPGASHEDGSDDDAEPTAKPTKARSKKSRRRSSRKINDFVATRVGSDSEPEFASLKGRRGKQPSRRGTSNDADGAGVELNTTKSGDQLVTPLQVDVIPVLKPLKMEVEEEDPIDALFAASDDHDVAKLYGGDIANVEEEDTSSVVEPQSKNQVAKSGSELFTQTSSTSLTDGEESGTTSAVATNANSGAPINREPSGHIHDISAQDLDDADEEEDFAINLAKMRKTNTRRRKSHRDPSDSSVNPDESVAADNTTDDYDLEPSLLGSQSDVEVVKNDARADRKDTPAPAPSAFLADAASNWMSVSTLEDESVNLSLTVDEDLSSPLGSMDEGKSIKLSLESAPTRRGTRDDEASLKPVVVSTDLAETGIAAELSVSSTKETSSTGNSDDPVGDLSHSELSFMEVNPESAKTEPPRESDATFDIFDKSGDVDFLSVTAPMHLKVLDHESEGIGGENGYRESFPDEDGAFSFEIKAPKKRASALEVETSNSVSEQVELSPPSPSPSTDDNVELGKYVSSSVPSSTTPSVDGSVDDPEGVAVDDESVLGKVESQAFDSDWNQMQAKEKERKKRLQAKQRQAQRDKVLRKQGVSSKALTGASTPHSSSKSKSKSGKKKKKDKEKDGTVQSSHHKKSGSSRKNRHRENGDAASATPSEPPRSLTEL
ncbi:hypothetical protein PR003_g540 [Phytophthora rubi]|uniref:FYVE-type domain-containing protein n=1 Tax=Phytophthora rubi TaxID=129364 RepID=A0A6A3PCP5_9STRA|nr:hypothetical protein PR002_g806 [Phytophthora rubi]KAE9052549.1 hypothetical protein PR001_g392 [Phytophthora rubi]KAE9359826.1 hypothetical protein PR003_g540 [Phytophthora rubi]